MMGPNFTPRWPLQGLLLMAVSMLIAGCGLTASHPRALLPLENFVPLASDPRVRVEPGFEAYGERVAQAKAVEVDCGEPTPLRVGLVDCQ